MMKSIPRLALRLAVPGSLLLALGGCVVAPLPQYGAAPAPYYGEAVTVEPPAPQVEVVGVAPAPGYFWIGGFWGWVGGRYQWNAGHWQAPRPGYSWVPHRWVAHPGGGWHAEPGHWEQRH
jgi:hypothetical protein